MSYASAMARVAAIQGQLAAYAPPTLPTPAPVEQPQESFQTVLDTQFGTSPAAPAIPGAATTGTTAAVTGLGEPSPVRRDDRRGRAGEQRAAGADQGGGARGVRLRPERRLARRAPRGSCSSCRRPPRGSASPTRSTRSRTSWAARKFLRGLLDRFGGDVSKVLAGYNAGPGAVEKYGGIPPFAETQAYVPKVLGFVEEYGGLQATGAPAAQPMAAGGAISSTGIPAGYALVPLSALGLQAPGATTALVPTATTTTTLPAPSTRGGQALDVARQYLGTPYRWGGESPATGFDCSGLMQYAFKQLGVDIPRVSQDQYTSGQQVPREALQPGDLVFFSKAGDVHHVGMYVGDGKFLHAPRTGDVVKISSLSEPHYAAEYCGARRYG